MSSHILAMISTDVNLNAVFSCKSIHIRSLIHHYTTALLNLSEGVYQLSITFILL